MSIVTAVRNGAGTLGRAIRSVLGQSYEFIEHIIVDGASTDSTLDVIRQFEDSVAYWISEPDIGLYDAMNKGIALASGTIISTLNADDEYVSDGVAAVVALSLAAPEAGILYGDVLIGSETRSVLYAGSIPPFDEQVFCRRMPVPHTAMFALRRCYEQHGLYRPSLRVAADFDWVVRNFVAGTRFAHIARPLTLMSPGGNSEREAAAARAEMRIILRHSGLGWRVRFCYAVQVVARSKLFAYLDRSRLGRLLIMLYRRGRGYVGWRSRAVRRNQALRQ